MTLDWWQLAGIADASVPYAVPTMVTLFLLTSLVLIIRIPDRRRLVPGLGLGLVVSAVIGSLLTPARSAGRLGTLGAVHGPLRCTVESAWPLRHTPIDLFNVLVFVPVAAFGIWSLRRWWLAPFLAAGLGLACELAQGTLPALGRVCDGADLVGYLVGIGLGTLIGMAGLVVESLLQPGVVGPRPDRPLAAAAGTGSFEVLSSTRGPWRDHHHCSGGGVTVAGSLASPGRSAGQPEGDPQPWRAREL
jgi:hypothetical protein